MEVNPIRLLRDAFPGSTVTHTMAPLISRTRPEQAAARGLCRRQIETCTACPLHLDMPKTPVPFTGGNKWGIMGEGPGLQESRQGKPFVGPSGRLLKSMLGHMGIDYSDAMWFNVVSCWPKVGEGKGVKTRAPNKEEVMACRTNLLTQVGLLTEPYILVVGGTALRAIRPDLSVSDVHGRPFVWHVEMPGPTHSPLQSASFYVLPIYHPASILRQPGLKATTLADLQAWQEILQGQNPPSFDPHCVRCGHPSDWWDPDGIAYCDKHKGRYGGSWKLAREQWVKKKEAEADAPPSLF